MSCINSQGPVALHKHTIYSSDTLILPGHVLFCAFHVLLQKISHLSNQATEKFVTPDAHGCEDTWNKTSSAEVLVIAGASSP